MTEIRWRGGREEKGERGSEINPSNVIQSVTNVTTANETSELD